MAFDRRDLSKCRVFTRKCDSLASEEGGVRRQCGSYTQRIGRRSPRGRRGTNRRHCRTVLSWDRRRRRIGGIPTPDRFLTARCIRYILARHRRDPPYERNNARRRRRRPDRYRRCRRRRGYRRGASRNRRCRRSTRSGTRQRSAGRNRRRGLDPRMPNRTLPKGCG